jgi:hypothetical protein
LVVSSLLSTFWFKKKNIDYFYFEFL